MPDTLQQTIAREVRAEMARQSKLHRDLAALLGISRTQLKERFAGRVEFRTSELERIAVWLDVPVAQFLGAVASR